MEKNTPPEDDQGWIEVINRLRAFSVDQIALYSWFRGEDALPKGYTPEDFVQDTILRYCENPALYNPQRGGFLAFLKYALLRRLVNNLSKLTENEQTTDIYKISSNEDEEDKTSYEDYLPSTITDIAEKIDYDSYIDLIIEMINGDILLENIFEGIFINNLKRRELCLAYNITEQAYDNGLRRLNTIIKTVKVRVK